MNRFLFLARRRRDERGAAAVEFALVLLPLMLLVGGIIDFGFGFNAQVSLTHAAREGVRVEALGTGNGKTRAEEAYTAIATSVGVGHVDQDCSGTSDDAIVSITADYEPFFVRLLPVPDTFTLSGEAVMRCGG